jgi:S-formylglutathione hydrolase FrmB
VTGPAILLRFSVSTVVRISSWYLAVLILVLLPSLSAAQSRIDCSSLDSRILRHPVRYCVMLPANYEAEKNKQYPVLYFLHGLGENEQTLMQTGGWGVIQDLQREGKVGDFLMAAPDGRGSFFINSADGNVRYSDFFLNEFLPLIETRYRVMRSRKNRGVTGLSMGGYGALRFAFARPELFGSVSAQSAALITESPRELNASLSSGGPLVNLLAGVFGDPINLAHWQLNNPFDLSRKNQIRLRTEAIYINCGAQDDFGFQEGAQKLHKQLAAEGIKHEFHLYPGNHSAEYFLSHLGETVEFHWRVFAKPAK